MPLSPQEEAEFQALHSKYGSKSPSNNNLSASEETELQALQTKFGGKGGPSNQGQNTATLPPEKPIYGSVTQGNDAITKQKNLMKTNPALAGMYGAGAVNPYAQIHGGRKVVENLPAAGSVIGGSIGGPASLITAPAGAAVGSLVKSALIATPGKVPTATEAMGQAGSDAIQQGLIPQALGLGTGAILKGLSKFIAPAVRRSNILDLVKRPAELGPKISEELGAANEAYNAKNIAPKMAQQQQLANGRSIVIKPAGYMGHDADVDAMMNKYLGEARAKSMYGSPDTVAIPMSDALEARAKLNKVSQFKPGLVYSDEAAARNKFARDAGDRLRSQIAVHPEVGQEISQLSDSLQNDYSLRNEVMRSAKKTPISTIKGSNLDKESNLARFDQKAGTNLSQTGQDIATAESRLGSETPSPFSKGDILKSAARQTVGRGGRIYDAAAQGLAPFIGNPMAQKVLSKAPASLYYLLNNQNQGQD